jgi:hypothetical protein
MDGKIIIESDFYGEQMDGGREKKSPSKAREFGSD